MLWAIVGAVWFLAPSHLLMQGDRAHHVQDEYFTPRSARSIFLTSLHDLQAGDTVTVPLAVNASGEYVQGADVEITFDDSLLAVTSCRAGVHAINRQGFECRYNIAGSLNSVQVSYVDNNVGEEWNTSASGPLFQLASIDFKV